MLLPAFDCVFQTSESSFRPYFCTTHKQWGDACCYVGYKWRGKADRTGRACVCVCVLLNLSGCWCMLYAPCIKSSQLQGLRVCVLRQPAELREHLHTVAQAFCLYTRLLPSNASRPSRLWPPRGSKGALPLKSQLCLILSARQVFHSPAVHLRSIVHNPLTSFFSYFWWAIVQV